MTPQPLAGADRQAAQRDAILIRVDPDIAALIPVFLGNRRGDVRDIRDALDRGDYALICRLGHNMKGVGTAFGFDAVTEIGAALEQTAKEEDALGVQWRADQLAIYLDRVEVV